MASIEEGVGRLRGAACSQLTSSFATLAPSLGAHPRWNLPSLPCRSDACIGSLGLQLCSTDGRASGAIAPAAAPAGTCTSSAACTTSQTCDTAQCTQLSKVRRGV